MNEENKEFSKEVVLDFWATNLHGDEIGIYDHKRRQAQTRSFTKDLDLVMRVKSPDEDGVIGIRKEPWNPSHPKDSLEYYMNKRLVLRWFKKTGGAKINLIGTIEELVLDSVRKTMISDDPLHSFRIILQDYPYVISLTKEHARLPGRLGEMWGFSLMTDKENEKWEIFLLDEKRFTIGTDFDAKKDNIDQVIVHIDEKILNIGKKVKLTFHDKRLYEYRPFFETIVLFASMFKYRKELRHKIKKARDLINKSKEPVTIDSQEMKLMKNPRAIRR